MACGTCPAACNRHLYLFCLGTLLMLGLGTPMAQVDEFNVETRDIGRVQSIVLEMSGKSAKPNWCLDMVVLQVRGARGGGGGEG